MGEPLKPTVPIDDEFDNNEEDDNDEFVDLDDVVEVEVDEENVPMDDDDDEIEDNEETEFAENENIVEMAKIILSTHSDHVYAVASHFETSTQTLHILTGSGDDKAYLHHINDTTTSVLLSHEFKDTVSSVALNMEYVSDNIINTPVYAAVGAFDGSIVIFDPYNGTKLYELEGPTDVEFLSFHPKGGSVLLAGSGEDCTVWMYHVPTQRCLQVFCGHESAVTAGGFTPDGKWALSASSDGTLRVWAPRTGMNKHVFRVTDAGLTCMATGGGPEGKLVLVGSEDGSAHICHVGTKRIISTVRHVEPPMATSNDEEEVELPLSVETVAFAPNAVNPNWFATGGVDGILKIWDMTNGHCRQTCRYEESKGGGITRLCWHPTQPLVYTASSDGVVRIWDARNGNLVSALTGHSDMINDLSIQFINDNKSLVVSGSDDNSVRVFDVDLASVFQNMP